MDDHKESEKFQSFSEDIRAAMKGLDATSAALTFPTILKGLREKAGYESQTKFAQASGVDNSTIARLERGETKPMPQTLIKIAPALHVDLNDLMIAAGYLHPAGAGMKFTKAGLNIFGYKEVKLSDSNKDLNKIFPGIDNEFVKVPILGSLKVGYDNMEEQEIIGYQAIFRANVSDGVYFYLKITDDSMMDAGIKEGHRVLVKHQDFVTQGKIAVVLINGDAGTLKRVYYQDSQLILQSENAEKKYPPLILNAEDVSIQGQVCTVEFDV